MSRLSFDNQFVGRKSAAKKLRHGYLRRLSFELLEDRRLLSITVNTLIDENDGIGVGGISLRDAIAAATPGETIDFDVTGTITLQHGKLSIDKSLTIDGPGNESLIIDASGNDPTPTIKNRDGTRIFSILSSGTPIFVSISDMTLTGGDEGNSGGAIEAYSNATFTNLVIENNAAHTGGGIAFLPSTVDTTLTIDNSIIRNNVAIFVDQFSGGGRAGGILVVSPIGGPSYKLDILESRIENNVAQNDHGGGIYLTDFSDGRGSEITIRDSIISGNTAGKNGGGLYAFWQPLFTDQTDLGKLLIERTTISDNTARVSGGAIFLIADPGNAQDNFEATRIDSSTISGNTAFGGTETDDGIRGVGGGGGIFKSYGLLGNNLTSTVINNSTISGNRALTGGGLYNLHGPQNGIGNRTLIRHSTIAFNIAGPFDATEYPDAPEISTVQQPTGGGGIMFGAIRGLTGSEPNAPNNNPSQLISFDHTVVASNMHLIDEATNHDHFPFGSDDNDNDRNFSPDFGVGPQPSDFGVVEGLGDPLTAPYYTFGADYSIFGNLGPSFHQWNVFDLVGSWSETDPALDPELADNGGPTLTHTPLPDSRAIDTGDPEAVAGGGTVPLYDQRGIPFTRVADGDGDSVARIDIGAVEVPPIPDEPCPIGDYNDDGTVNAADYTVWRDNLDTGFDLPNEDPTATPGEVTPEDYDAWKTHFGETCPEFGAVQLDVVLGEHHGATAAVQSNVNLARRAQVVDRVFAVLHVPSSPAKVKSNAGRESTSITANVTAMRMPGHALLGRTFAGRDVSDDAIAPVSAADLTDIPEECAHDFALGDFISRLERLS